MEDFYRIDKNNLQGVYIMYAKARWEHMNQYSVAFIQMSATMVVLDIVTCFLGVENLLSTLAYLVVGSIFAIAWLVSRHVNRLDKYLEESLMAMEADMYSARVKHEISQLELGSLI